MYIFTITLLADIYTSIDDISVATDSGCICGGMMVTIFKSMNYQLNQKNIERLIVKILKCTNDLVEFSVDSDRVTDIIRRHCTFNKIIFYGFTVLGCLLVIALLLLSPMKNGLPIRAKYPFDTTIYPYREIALAVESVAISSGMLAILSMEGLTILMCNYTTMQFDILNVNFENCNGKTANKTGSVYRKPNDTFMTRYKTCLRFHQQLMSTTNDYNNIFSQSEFFQMLSSTSIICLTGFQAVAVGGQNLDIIKFGVYLSAATSQLFYICWMGNELTYSCSVLDRSQWLSNWHHERFSSNVQLFVLSTMSVRHPLYMKAGPFYVCSLKTYIAIIRFSYSMFTLLNNMHTTDS
ncbi:odorant receptor 13a-like [Lasioglossum baleicum]|uniref:odorant receptor 13a-like n=1 Tax=Lasioglossum baleicum TaxID=434251 RepID=UPI003FCD0223